MHDKNILYTQSFQHFIWIKKQSSKVFYSTQKQSWKIVSWLDHSQTIYLQCFPFSCKTYIHSKNRETITNFLFSICFIQHFSIHLLPYTLVKRYWSVHFIDYGSVFKDIIFGFRKLRQFQNNGIIDNRTLTYLSLLYLFIGIVYAYVFMDI